MVSLLHGLTESEPLLAFASPPDQQEAADILERIRADLHPGQLAFVDDQDTEILGLAAARPTPWLPRPAPWLWPTKAIPAV
jgi:hypothetical protein